MLLAVVRTPTPFSPTVLRCWPRSRSNSASSSTLSAARSMSWWSTARRCRCPT